MVAEKQAVVHTCFNEKDAEAYKAPEVSPPHMPYRASPIRPPYLHRHRTACFR